MKILLALKADYKAATGKDWKPGQQQAKQPAGQPQSVAGGTADDLNEKIVNQGNVVRDLKSKKAEKVNKIVLKIKRVIRFVNSLPHNSDF